MDDVRVLCRVIVLFGKWMFAFVVHSDMHHNFPQLRFTLIPTKLADGVKLTPEHLYTLDSVGSFWTHGLAH